MEQGFDGYWKEIARARGFRIRALSPAERGEPSRRGRELALDRCHELLRAAGADVEELIGPPAEHRVHPHELDALRRLVEGLRTGTGRRTA